MKTKAQKLTNRKKKERTFKEDTSLGKIQDEITEIKQRLDDLENK